MSPDRFEIDYENEEVFNISPDGVSELVSDPDLISKILQEDAEFSRNAADSVVALNEADPLSTEEDKRINNALTFAYEPEYSGGPSPDEKLNISSMVGNTPIEQNAIAAELGLPYDNRLIGEESIQNTDAGMFKGATDSIVPTDRGLMIYGDLKKKGPVEEGPLLPTIKNFLSQATDSALNVSAATSAFTEDQDPQLTQALQQSSPMQQRINRIATDSSTQRAITGASLGSVVGAQFMGQTGAAVGGAIGAYAGRSAGMAKSGEQARLNRDNRIWQSLKTMGAVKENGTVQFEDSTVQMPFDATGRLKNLRTNVLNGAKDRSLYELDTSNPLTQRALMLAKPLGMFYAEGMLGYGNKKNPVDADAAKSATNMFVNTFIQDANNQGTVIKRAREMKKKLGASKESLYAYFNRIKKDLTFDQAADLQKNIEILCAEY